ncbi:MAG: DUF4252 domain-containing protein [Bacteroidaceae bacterium]|nr:DUF4252 domain-containing protein [Bacteroidaceae bacterium]
MKKFALLALTAMMAVSMSAQSGKQLYKKYFDNEGMETVHISGFLLRTAGRAATVDLDGKDFSKFARSLKGLYIITAQTPDTRAALGADIRKIIRKGDLESLMESSSDGQKMMMYINGNDDDVTELAIVTLDEETVTLVSLEGRMSRSEIERWAEEEQM